MTTTPHEMLEATLGTAAATFPVFPVSRKKVPMTEHGMLDATCDPEQIRAWWTARPAANIGMRPPESVAVIDVDPRNGGEDSWKALLAEHGPIIETLTCVSGAGDGGRHLYFLHPGGKLRTKPAPGIDVKTHSGFVVVPPSVRAQTGLPYRWEDPSVEIAAMPVWLAKLVMRPTPPPVPRRPLLTGNQHADSIADWFTLNSRWTEDPRRCRMAHRRQWWRRRERRLPVAPSESPLGVLGDDQERVSVRLSTETE